MERTLVEAIQAVHPVDGWVHLGTVGADGGPHVTPVMMGVYPAGLLFSVTGKQKKRNIQRDSRVCISISKPGSLAHVIVWGRMELRDDAEAQKLWEKLITDAFGEAGLQQRARGLSPEGTSLGIVQPEHHRIFGLD